jgi:hypothetical protein
MFSKVDSRTLAQDLNVVQVDSLFSMRHSVMEACGSAIAPGLAGTEFLSKHFKFQVPCHPAVSLYRNKPQYSRYELKSRRLRVYTWAQFSDKDLLVC